MKSLQNKTITAVFITAVMLTAMFVSGCVTPRHIDELKMEIREIKSDNQQTREMVAHMDSLITAGAEASNKLRNDVSYSTDQMQQQIDALLNNYNELMLIAQQINQKVNNTKYTIRSSPGVQGGTQEPVTQQPVNQTPQQPSVDCGTLYDDSFILTRRGEYEQAIEKFTEFLKDCPQHENVENAHYWIAESYYSLDKFVEAAEKFTYLTENFKSTSNMSRALYQLGRCNQELNKTDEAKRVFQKVIDDFPGSFEANQAAERIKDL